MLVPLMMAGCGSGGNSTPEDYFGRLTHTVEQTIPCPVSAEIWFVAGQSNAGNSAIYPKPTQSDKVVQYFKGNCYAAKSPLLGGTGPEFNPFEEVAKRYAEQNNKQVIVAVYAIGGQSIDNFIVNGKFNVQFMQELKELSAFRKVHRFLWQQGETDAIQGTKYSDYKYKFNSLVYQVQPYVNKIYAARSTMCVDGILYDNEVGSAITDLWAETGHYGPDTDLITRTIENRYDGCHLNIAGVESFTNSWLSVLK